MQIDLSIAGESIRLSEPENHPAFMWPFWPFDLFQIALSSNPNLSFQIHVVPDLPAFSKEKLIFDSDQGLWKLYERENGFLIERLDTKTHGPHSLALLNSDFSRAEIWFRECPDPLGGKERGWIPAEVINPLVEICILTRLARCGGLLLHASVVKVEGRTYVFSGPSGAGKSTIAELFQKNIPGSVILSDEKTILSRHPNGIVAHGTPWYGSSHCAVNDSAPLANFYLIAHGQGKHEFRPLSGVNWNCRVLREGTFPHWDRQGMEETTLFLSELMQHSKRRELSFLKEDSVVDFVMRGSWAHAPEA